jgi:hypothetical protein
MRQRGSDFARRFIDGARLASFDAGVRIVAVVFVSLLVGCSSATEDTSSPDTVSTPSEVATLRSGLPSPYPGAGVDCPPKEPSPLSIGRTIEVLRAHGFTVAEVEGSCGAQLISGLVSNAGSGSTSFVMRREGSISCFVLVEPEPASLPVVEGDTTATSAERRLANLHCRLYGPKAAGFSAYVQRLDGAFAELQQPLKP